MLVLLQYIYWEWYYAILATLLSPPFVDPAYDEATAPLTVAYEVADRVGETCRAPAARMIPFSILAPSCTCAKCLEPNR
jgi:hypothetical protein